MTAGCQTAGAAVARVKNGINVIGRLVLLLYTEGVTVELVFFHASLELVETAELLLFIICRRE